MPVYLIRHAHAGSRAGWDGEDAHRPLSPKGRHQAEGIAAWLADSAIDAVRSSPSTRCHETVEPLADGHGLKVEIDEALAEGGPVDACIEAVLAAAPDNVVLCSHGDLIPKVMRRLVADGMRASHANLSQKGSTWVLDIAAGRVVTGTYHGPFNP